MSFELICTTTYNLSASKKKKLYSKPNCVVQVLAFLMEVVEEEEEDLSELCAEILENWTSPIYSDLVDTSLHQNPFSRRYHHQQPPNAAYHNTESTIKGKADRVSNCPLQLSLPSAQPNKTLSSFTDEISTSKPKYDYSAEHFGFKQKQESIMNALRTSYNGRGSKCEQGDDQNQPLIPLLVADTFFDKVLGHGVDGVDIAALNKAKEGKESCDDLRTILKENDAVTTTVSTINNGKESSHSGQKSSLRFKCIFPMANRMPKRSTISGETRCPPATSTPVTSEIRSSSDCGFVANFRFMLPPNTTIFDINIDNFGEKLWRNPGANMSDFFNYGLDEKQWKDYCKLMQAKGQVGRFGPSKVIAAESRQSHKEALIGEVKSKRGINECLPSMDLSFYNSDVTVERVMRDSFYKNELRREHTKEDGVLRDAEGAKLLSSSRNTQLTKNSRMINGEKILPFPMDSYSTADKDRDKGERKKDQSLKNHDAWLTQPSRERKAGFSEDNYSISTNIHKSNGGMNRHSGTIGQNVLAYRKLKQNYMSSHGKEMVKVMDAYEMGKQHSSRNQREYSLNHVCQRNQERSRFRLGHQTSHNKLNVNLAKSLCSPRVKEFVREKIENTVSEGVQRESVSGITPINGHNSETEMEAADPVEINVQEDPQKLKRRSERFKIPLPNLKNVLAEKSLQSERNTLLPKGTATTDSDIKNQGPTRRRKWTSS